MTEFGRKIRQSCLNCQLSLNFGRTQVLVLDQVLDPHLDPKIGHTLADFARGSTSTHPSSCLRWGSQSVNAYCQPEVSLASFCKQDTYHSVQLENTNTCAFVSAQARNYVASQICAVPKFTALVCNPSWYLTQDLVPRGQHMRLQREPQYARSSVKSQQYKVGVQIILAVLYLLQDSTTNYICMT